MNHAKLLNKVNQQFLADEARRACNGSSNEDYYVEISGKACIHKSVFIGDPHAARSHLAELLALRGKPAFQVYVKDLSKRRRDQITSVFGSMVDDWCIM